MIRNTGAADLSLVKNGSERFTLSNDGNSYTGTTTINGGILRLGNNGATGSIGTGELIINAGALELRKDANFNFTNDISGAGAFQKLFAGTVTTLSGNKDGHTGQTDIFAGTLKGGGTNVFGANSAYNISHWG